ncbi:MAG: radical SAM protein [Planctomycetota bacterium]
MTRKFFLCYFESTRRCNLKCFYCMTRRDEADCKNELTTDEVKHFVLDEVRKICANGSVAFSGGEFLLRKDALELLEYNNRLGLYSFINTNGLCLTPKLLKEIKKVSKNRVAFGFPLNSVVSSVNRQSRDDNSERIMNLVELCDKEGMGYFFVVTISKLNLSTLAQTIELMKSRKIPLIRSPFVPRGAGSQCQEKSVSSQDMKEIAYPLLRDNYLSYISYTPFFAEPEFMRKTWSELDIPIANFGCQAGRSFIGISAEGEVAPCLHLLDTNSSLLKHSTKVNSPSIGNVRTQYLAKMMNTSPILTNLEDGSKLKGKCGRCRYKHTCSGCRAIAYYHSGDYLAEDPTCFFEPENELTISPDEKIHNENVSKFIKFLVYNKPWNQIFKSMSLKKKIKAVLWSLDK